MKRKSKKVKKSVKKIELSKSRMIKKDQQNFDDDIEMVDAYDKLVPEKHDHQSSSTLNDSFSSVSSASNNDMDLK